MKKKKGLYKKQEWQTPEYRREQKRHIKLIKGRGKQTDQEKKMYEDFKKIAEEDFRNENKEKKFRFWHLEKVLELHNVNPAPHIKFLYGKKNIGKTWELARKVARMHAEDPDAQFVIVRNKAQDKEAIEEMFKDEIWPVETIGNKLYWKEEKRKGAKKRNSVNRKQAGLFVWSTSGGFQTIQGSSHKNIKLIVWDECNDTDGTALTPQTLYKFYVFTSSIIRDKGKDNPEEAVETYMIGNLLSKGDQTMNLFLSKLNVDPNVTLKMIDIHLDGDPNKAVVSRLLYVNTFDFYEGIEKQVGLSSHFLTEDEQSSLLMNKQNSFFTKAIFSEWDLYKASPQLSLIFTLREEGILNTYILYIARVKGTLIFIAWIEEFRPSRIKLGYRPFTNDLLTTCNFVAPTFLKEKQFVGILKLIANLLLLGQLFYGYNNSLQLFAKFWNAHERIYRRGKNQTRQL